MGSSPQQLNFGGGCAARSHYILFITFTSFSEIQVSSEYLRFSASGGPLGGPPEPPSELVQSILLNVDALAGIAMPAMVINPGSWRAQMVCHRVLVRFYIFPDCVDTCSL